MARMQPDSDNVPGASYQPPPAPTIPGGQYQPPPAPVVPGGENPGGPMIPSPPPISYPAIHPVTGQYAQHPANPSTLLGGH